jgi:hypothetical protein
VTLVEDNYRGLRIEHTPLPGNHSLAEKRNSTWTRTNIFPPFQSSTGLLTRVWIVSRAQDEMRFEVLKMANIKITGVTNVFEEPSSGEYLQHTDIADSLFPTSGRNTTPCRYVRE